VIASVADGFPYIPESSPPFTPKENGVSEQMNQNYKRKGRGMMVERKLRDILWGETMKTANYPDARALT
jgi:hypothetical protein